jgi:hypothetical protein
MPHSMRTKACNSHQLVDLTDLDVGNPDCHGRKTSKPIDLLDMLNVILISIWAGFCKGPNYLAR